jgi:hypothetical protein
MFWGVCGGGELTTIQADRGYPLQEKFEKLMKFFCAI